MKSDKNGCSTCKKGKEHYEQFYSQTRRCYLWQYDYRVPEGFLFTCVASSLERCRKKCDAWLKEHNFGERNV